MGENKNKSEDEVEIEILRSEQEYFLVLTSLYKSFHLPLERAVGTKEQLMKRDNVNKLFGGLDSIRDLVEGLVQQMKERGGGPVLVDLFTRSSWGVKNYSRYIAGFPDALHHLRRKLHDHPQFLKFVQGVEEQSGFKLEDMLERPVHRVEEYVDMLRKLVASTPLSHPDRVQRFEALDCAERLSEEVLESAKSVAQDRELEMLQMRFGGSLEIKSTALVDRFLVKSGELTKICRKNDKVFSFFLFSDMLVYAEGPVSAGPENRLRLHRAIGMDEIASFKHTDAQRDGKFGILVHTTQKSFVVYTDSADERNAWLVAYTTAREKSRIAAPIEGVDVAPVWKPDNSVDSCMLCNRKFKMLRRKHHCRVCGDIICDDCSLSRTDLKFELLARVCDKCVDNNCLPPGFMATDSDNEAEAQQPPISVKASDSQSHAVDSPVKPSVPNASQQPEKAKAKGAQPSTNGPLERGILDTSAGSSAEHSGALAEDWQSAPSGPGSPTSPEFNGLEKSYSAVERTADDAGRRRMPATKTGATIQDIGSKAHFNNVDEYLSVRGFTAKKQTAAGARDNPPSLPAPPSSLEAAYAGLKHVNRPASQKMQLPTQRNDNGNGPPPLPSKEPPRGKVPPPLPSKQPNEGKVPPALPSKQPPRL